MNILRRELRAGLKPFLLWTLGIFVLVFAGMTKYTGFAETTGDASVSEMFDAFPRVVLAVFGMVGIDITTLGGYYAIVIYFAMVCGAIYAVSLGTHAVGREQMDKTYEFLFVKPRSRAYILGMKLVAALIYLVAFSLVNYVFSIAAIATLGFDSDISKAVILFTIGLFLVCLLFLSIAAFVAAVTKNIDHGGLYGNLIYLGAFILSVIYDMLENGGLLKLLAPFKYFAPDEVLAGTLDPAYTAICLCAAAAFCIGAFSFFQKKDFTA